MDTEQNTQNNTKDSITSPSENELSHNISVDGPMCEESEHLEKKESAMIMCLHSECNKKIICLQCAFNKHQGHTMAKLDDISNSIREEIVEEFNILGIRLTFSSEKISKLEDKLADMCTLRKNIESNISDKKILLEQEKFLDVNRILPSKFNRFLTINLSNQINKSDHVTASVSESESNTSNKNKVESLLNKNKVACDGVEFNLLLVGSEGVGKTAFVERHLGNFKNEYDCTVGREVHTINLITNRGNIKFNIYECSTNSSLYPKNIDCAIIMYDKFNKFSLAALPLYDKILKSQYGLVPIVICGNRSNECGLTCSFNNQLDECDTMYSGNTKALLIKFNKERNPAHFHINVKYSYNLDAPLIYLARKLTSDNYINMCYA